MADGSPSFMSGLMAGLNNLPTNPLFNMGLGLMDAARPFGNVGESLMRANQVTMQNQSARQDQQMKQIQLNMANMKLPVLEQLFGASAQGAPAASPGPSQGAPPAAVPSFLAPSGPTQAPQIGLDSLMADSQGGQSAAKPPNWLTAPTQGGIDALPVNGMDPRLLRQYSSVVLNKDPIETDKAIQAQQLALAQRQYAPAIARLDDVVKGDVPTRMVSADPDLKAAWNAVAPQYGYDATKDFTDANVRQAFGHVANTLRAPLGQATQAPPVQVQHSQEGAQQVETNPVTGERKYTTDVRKLTQDQAQNMKIAQQKLAMEKQKQDIELGRFGVPAGYEPAPTADNPKAIRPIEGGPADPLGTGGGMGSRGELMFKRVTAAGNSAAESLKNIADLPISSSTGWLGGYQPPTTLFGATKAILAQKVQPQDVQDYKTMMVGVSRNLASLETSGLSPGGSLTHSLDALTIGEGDTQMTKLRKLAEARQIIETNLSVQLSDPKIPGPQKDMVRGIISKTQNAIPFTNADITSLEKSKKPGATIMDFAKSEGLGASPATAPPMNTKGWALHVDAKGNQAYVSPDGKSFEEVH